MIFMLILGNVIFFLKFPLYRYGYSYTISLISILFSLAIFSYNLKIVKKIFYYILILSFIALTLKQFIRIKNNFDKRNIWPNLKSFLYDSQEIKLENKIIGNNFKIYINNNECMYIKSPCTNNFNQNLSHKKYLNYDLVFIEK